jgi:hypothetical protein
MIKFRINKKTFWYSKELVLFFLVSILSISLFLFAFNDEKKRRIILFFPEDNYTETSGDFHIVPMKKTPAGNMKMTLNEALLRPLDYRLNPIVPENVKINSFIFNQEDRELFIDLSVDMIRVGDSNQRGVEDAVMLDLLKKNLYFNHRTIKNIQFP